ncbi:amino acid ABC transporter substrate-binding protein, partial [Vibrio fluvialis]|nr:amino acid ABC transporter substrate-binding protein [Vibrio fluvialis]
MINNNWLFILLSNLPVTSHPIIIRSHKMKNWIKLAVAALALSAATVQAATDVKVGMSGRYFPFTFVKQDQLQGFEVD